jgi:glucose/arabinose dehydrogenase
MRFLSSLFGGLRREPSRCHASPRLALEPLEGRTLLDGSVPFTIGGDARVHPEDFRITRFARGLNYPYSMLQLSDGSLLVGTSKPASANFFDSTGQLIRLVDANQNGIADSAGKVLFTGLPGEVTSVHQAGSLFFVTSSEAGSEQIAVLRAGPTPASQLSLVGAIRFGFSANWEHTTYENAVRPTPSKPGYYDLFFNVGSQANFVKTTATVPLSGLVTGTVKGDSIYKVTVHDTGSTFVFSRLMQVATGLRNAAGMAFNPQTGDFFFEDNGIDGGGNPEEELSTDELNMIPARGIGVNVYNFGFPSTYIDYFTGQRVGSGGIQPFTPFIPGTGPEIAGATKIAFAPAGFPAGLNNGIFVGFHGGFDDGGVNNDENPVAFVDLSTRQYFRFIANSVPGVGHLDGLLSTSDSLFIADMSSNGDIFGTAGRGVIYQIKYQPSSGPSIPSRVMGQEELLVRVSKLASSTDAVFASAVGAAPAGAGDDGPMSALVGLEDADAGLAGDPGAGMKYDSLSNFGITKSSGNGSTHGIVHMVRVNLDPSPFASSVWEADNS